jgi:hypothetical protein
VAYERGSHLIAVNTVGEERPLPARAGEVVLETATGVVRNGALGPNGGAVLALV